MKTEHKTINTSLTPKIKANLSLEDFHMPFNSTGFFIYKNMKAKVLYSIEQEQFTQIHRVYLETHFDQAEKDFEMLKDVATCCEVHLDDIDCYGEGNGTL